MNPTAIRMLSVCLLTATAIAQSNNTDRPVTFDYGGDLRIRQEAFDHIPFLADPPGVTRGGENNAFRIRPRIWGSAQSGAASVHARLTQEFRHYLEPDTPSAWDWPDEVIVDQLFFNLKGLADGAFDIRIGRQDLMYGAGRVILEGTPKDGSRTIFFDAAKITWHLNDTDTIDVLGIYNRSEAGLEIGPLDRDNTGFDKYNNDLTESGGGVYARINRFKQMPAEGYYLFKEESSWKSFAAGDPPTPERRPGRRRIPPAHACCRR